MEFPILDQIGFSGFLSEWGKKIFMPQGIFYWSGRAKKEAEVNATLGSAVCRMDELVGGEDKTQVVCHLPSMSRFFEEIGPNDVFAYAPVLGRPTFRKAWKDWIVYKGGDQGRALSRQITLPMATSGVTMGLWMAAKLFADPHEAVICPEKRWGNYDAIFTLHLGNPVNNFTFFQGKRFNVPALQQALTQAWKTQDKVILFLNIPNNPTGYTPDAEEAAAIRKAIVTAVKDSGKKLILALDDAYEGYVYDDKGIRRSMFYDFIDADPNLLPIKLDGVTKELLWYGGRLGAMTFGLHKSMISGVDEEALARELDTKVSGVVRSSISNCCNVTQTITERVLADKEKLLKERAVTVDLLTERYKLMQKHMAAYDPNVLTVDPCNGGFFAFVNVKGVSATKVAETLITKYKVAVVPSEKAALGMNGLRIAFCGVPADEIERMCAAIPKAVKDSL